MSVPDARCLGWTALQESPRWQRWNLIISLLWGPVSGSRTEHRICLFKKKDLSAINLNRIWLGWTTEKFNMRKSRVTLGTYWLFIGKQTPRASPICLCTLFGSGNLSQKSIQMQLKKNKKQKKSTQPRGLRGQRYLLPSLTTCVESPDTHGGRRKQLPASCHLTFTYKHTQIFV